MAKEFGWAYVVGSQASGPRGSVQLAGGETELDHDPNLLWSDDQNALLVSGNIIAHNFEIQNQTKTVFHFEVSGSSVFGDTSDDIHQFTGSIDVSGNITAVSFHGYGGDLEGVAINEYTNFGDNRLITSAGAKSVNAEDGLTFDGDLLYVSGGIESFEISSSLAMLASANVGALQATSLTDGVITIETGTIAGVDHFEANTLGGTLTTASQPNITQVGALNSLSVNGNATLGLDVIHIDSIAKRVGVSKNLPQKKVEIKDTDTQLRLTYSDAIFGISQYRYADLQATSTGDLSLLPSSGKVIAPALQLTDVQQGTANSYLSIDGNGNVILAPSVQSSIEVRNRTLVTGSYSVQTDDYFIALNANQNLTVTLPDASTLFNGQIMVIKDEAINADTYDLYITCQVGQTIDGTQQIKLASPGSAVNFYTDGQTRFFIF